MTPHLRGKLLERVNAEERNEFASPRTELHITSVPMIPEVAYFVPEESSGNLCGDLDE